MPAPQVLPRSESLALGERPCAARDAGPLELRLNMLHARRHE